jgi:putative ABC transport system permease protein
LIAQQSAIFLGIVSRSYRMVTDIPLPEVWVIDPMTESEDKVRALSQGNLDIVRSVPGVEWAVAINMMNVPLVTPGGEFQVSTLYGLDEASLIGAPPVMLEGNIRDLQRPGAIIVDIYSSQTSLARVLPDGSKVPLQLGDEFEINGRRAIVVGISKITQGFFPQPIVFTGERSFENFTSWDPNKIAFIAVKTVPGMDVQEVANRINSNPALSALTRDQMRWKIIDYFLKTGILINFGLSVALGIIIGFSIAGQIFYIMTLENLRFYALIKAVGGTKGLLFQMISAQALLVGAIGFSLGIGATVLWGWAIQNTTLAFLFPWELLLFTGVIVLIICLFTAMLSIRKVFSIDPKMLLGT